MDSGIQSMGDMAVTQGMSSTLSAKSVSRKDADKTSKDFEAMFMSQMLQPMFDSVSVDPNFGGGHAEEIMRSFLVQEYGKIAAKSGHLGIASMVKNEMIRAQSVASHPVTDQGGLNVPAQ